MSLTTLEMICAPYAIYTADTGTAAPELDEDPDSDIWSLLGTAGTKSYDDKGVTIAFDEQLNTFKGAGSTGNRKVWRVSESVSLSVDVADVSIGTVAKAHNNAVVTQRSPGIGLPGKSSMHLLKGTDVAQFAVLARGLSPAEAGMTAHFWCPVAYQAGKPSIVYSEQGVAMVAFQFVTLEDDTDGFGLYEVQTADAS